MMNTITITLPDDQLQQLKKIAGHFHVSPEELVCATVSELITRHEEKEFELSLNYVLHKNPELYEHLA